MKSVEISIILKVAKFSYEWELPPSAMQQARYRPVAETFLGGIAPDQWGADVEIPARSALCEA